MRRRSRIGLLAAAGAGVIASAGPAASEAQAPPPVASAGVEGGALTLDTRRFQVKVEFNTSLGVLPPQPPPIANTEALWFFSDKNLELITRVLQGPGCFGAPSFRFFVFCQPQPINRFVIRLGPLDDKFRIWAEVPKVPGGGRVGSGAGDDGVSGGKNDEKIDTGKGKDDVNPGPGNDEANLGPGKDTANTRDGEADTLNGGKGEDAATVDKKDKVKNVEKVRRK